MKTFSRTSPGAVVDRLPGWRLILPLLVWRRKGFDIHRDEMFDGRWVWTMAFNGEPLGNGPHRHGLSLRITWGWITRPNWLAA